MMIIWILAQIKWLCIIIFPDYIIYLIIYYHIEWLIIYNTMYYFININF